MHYNACFGTRKTQNALNAEAQRKSREIRKIDSRSENVTYTLRRASLGPPKGGPNEFDFPLSPLLAHTCTPDRCKSFISTHITDDPPGVGVCWFFVRALMWLHSLGFRSMKRVMSTCSCRWRSGFSRRRGIRSI